MRCRWRTSCWIGVGALSSSGQTVSPTRNQVWDTSHRFEAHRDGDAVAVGSQLPHSSDWEGGMESRSSTKMILRGILSGGVIAATLGTAGPAQGQAFPTEK